MIAALSILALASTAAGQAAPPPAPAAPVTMAEVLANQEAWKDAILAISNSFLRGGDYIDVANEAAARLYGYADNNVLFKPTKAAEFPFRPTATGALSYFVGGDVVDGGFAEDGGFAINGGDGWSNVTFVNHQIDLNGGVAIAMGTYFFTSAKDGSVSEVHYTFAYKRSPDGIVRIFVHHSSVPYAEPPTPITEAEVLTAQDKWARAILDISRSFLTGGDYIQNASNAAAELYGYANMSVLFKPTQAAEYPFRPTATGALSYFVGGGVVDGGFEEDGGFAINGGDGWSNVIFQNHQIDLNGDIAVAMGTYYFTSAKTGEDTEVHYTFGYKRNPEGEVRIFVHHSSVPYAEAPKKVEEAQVLA
eukprot:jgi/Bigna1/36961/e_gw1.17.78.1